MAGNGQQEVISNSLQRREGDGQIRALIAAQYPGPLGNHGHPRGTAESHLVAQGQAGGVFEA
eukprot:CAMPEP_0173173734 /NCGR_PEP_ID=MMETSP1141-20130122/2985_1 /TAXON_ID=483371 /ORGANISM="non described non described, Strain CCMP2298" /LENGTH=61 /DNA_ID=CAMNT_0014095827 /DNA_START=249 /DNA_END=434 /DNA_ORIENTATION=-